MNGRHIPLHKILELELDAEKCLKVKVCKNCARFFCLCLFIFLFIFLYYSLVHLCCAQNFFHKILNNCRGFYLISLFKLRSDDKYWGTHRH